MRPMKLSVIACAALLALGCQKGSPGASNPQNEDTVAKVAELSKRVDDIDGRLKRIETLLQQYLEGPAEPDPQAVYSVPIDGYPSVGPATAQVTIVKAYEFACGFCYRVRPTLQTLLADYAGKVRIVYKPFVVHADVAVLPAMAACAADKQGKFLAMENAIWEKGFAQRDLGEEKINALAQEIGLDMERYRKDKEGTECMDSLRASVANLGEVGVSGTPTFYINGRALTGAQPIEAFKKIIDEELAKADRAIASGTPAASYYQKVVVEGGKKSVQ